MEKISESGNRAWKSLATPMFKQGSLAPKIIRTGRSKFTRLACAATRDTTSGNNFAVKEKYAGRLKPLTKHGIIEKNPYQPRPVRYVYTLTKKGKELGPILLAMKDWGLKQIPGTKSMF